MVIRTDEDRELLAPIVDAHAAREQAYAGRVASLELARTRLVEIDAELASARHERALRARESLAAIGIDVDLRPLRSSHVEHRRHEPAATTSTAPEPGRRMLTRQVGRVVRVY